MSQVIITEYTYIFYCNGDYFAQRTFDSDNAAIRYAQGEQEERGMPVKVARWLEVKTDRLVEKEFADKWKIRHQS